MTLPLSYPTRKGAHEPAMNRPPLRPVAGLQYR